MKICPNCRKTYPDDNLNFCLEDGTVLTLTRDDPPATVMMGQPRPTDPQTLASQGGIQSTFGAGPQYAAQSRSGSKAWVWVLGIVGVLVLLCGGVGVVGLIFYAASENGPTGNTSNDPLVANSRKKGPLTDPSPSNSSSPPPVEGDVEDIDLSQWVKDFSVWGTTEMDGDELIMAAKEKGYYYVLVAPKDYSTDGASTRVTVRNVDNASSSLGYGLIFHSSPTPLTQDYAFLIDSKRKRYRVVRHVPEDELSLIPWTTTSTIHDGAQENVLEAKDMGGTIDLYINDSKVNSIKDSYGFPKGVPGLYSGDGVHIGFKKLQIRK